MAAPPVPVPDLGPIFQGRIMQYKRAQLDALATALNLPGPFRTVHIVRKAALDALTARAAELRHNAQFQSLFTDNPELPQQQRTVTLILLLILSLRHSGARPLRRVAAS